ncbi:MAG: glycoside hydrolase family 78 protein [Sporolactobacillus sp.]|jgi:alpha-L-rhamnosidase|nr:glycoside hydrolase family 78 protein [Sporolactobacillus sp.]
MTNALQAPYRLKVNLLDPAWGVDKNDLRFSWANRGSAQHGIQSAYQLRMVKRRNDIATKNDVYDSGWVTAARNAAVSPARLGNVLQDNELYYWQVRIKSADGTVSPFSEPMPLVTAAADQWADITAVETAKHGHFTFFRSPVFRLTLRDTEKVIVSAAARDTDPLVQENFDLFVNGYSVGYGPGRPHLHVHEAGRSPYTRLFYNTYDITNLIQDGDNVIAALTGRTIFLKDGDNVLGEQSADKRRQGMFLVQVTLFDRDGSRQIVTVSSDGTWKTLDGAAAFRDRHRTIGTQYFAVGAEDIDTRAYPLGWANVDFDDRNWLAPTRRQNIYDPQSEAFLPYPSENTLRFVCNEPAKRLTKLAGGDVLIDLGQEIVGGLWVNLDSPEEHTIDVYAGEQLNDDGTVRYHLACEPVYHERWTLKKGRLRFGTCTMACFRYVQIHGFAGSLRTDSVNGWALRQSFDASLSAFASDNELLNRQYGFSKYTIQATNQDIYVDSQARERRPYEGDLLVNGSTSYAVSDHYSLARYSIDFLLDNETWPDDYKLFNVEFAWKDYLYTGDRRLLEARYPRLRQKMLLGKNGIDNFDERVGLVTGIGLIDWPKNERDGYVEGTYNTPFNAIYAGVYTDMACIAAALGNRSDESFYRHRAQVIKSQLLRRLYDRDTGTFFDSMNADGTINRHRALHSSAYALAYHVVPTNRIDVRLTDFVGNGGVFKGSIYFAYFILRGLFNGNAGDRALRLLLNPDAAKDAKTFAAVLDTLKATIAPEAWSNKHKPNLTLSHPWGATPGCMIAEGMFGIRPTAPGFAHFQMKVQPGPVHSAKLTYPSIKGPIQAGFARDASGRLSCTADIPLNTRATIALPAGERLFVDGRPVVAAIETGFLSAELPAGYHEIATAAD